VITGAGLDPSCTPAGIPPNGSHGEGCWGRLPQVEKELNPIPGSYKPDGLWETHAQPGALPLDSISWNDCQAWLQRLNRWLTSEWTSQGGQGEPPQFSLPGEGQ
jgi:hypothetical protein